MTDDTAAAASPRERALRPDRVYVGWRYARLHPDPGPPPRRPVPPERPHLDPEWVAKQRRDENALNRPIKIAALAAAGAALLFVLLWAVGVLPAPYATLGTIAALFVVVITGYAIWQGEQALRSRIEEEKAKIARADELAQAELMRAHQRHAAAYREWERRRKLYESQKDWYPVSVPQGVDRIDVAGGTLAGWRAMVTMMGAARLDSGSQITVLDLSEGAMAGDLVSVARATGRDPLVWVLPSDLPRLDLTSTLDAEALADVLSLVVSVSEEQGPTRDLSFDNAILERVLTVFGGQATIAQITAALRALAQVGDPRDDIKLGLLTEQQLEKIALMFGRGADRVVIERAWALESQLRKLETLGTEPFHPPAGAALRVVSMDRRAGVFTNRVLGTYVVTALTHLLRESPPQQPWGHTLFICGADKLRGDVLDRLVDACETTSTGLVLMYRSLPQHVRDRLGRGNAAVGFMRLGNADDARVAGEHIGKGHRFEVARLTVGITPEVSDAAGAKYTSTVGAGGADTSARPTAADVESLTEGIVTSTGWGSATDSAMREAAAEAPPGRDGGQELRVEPQQLQELPPTAMIFTYPTADGREILLVDANPGILALPPHRLSQDASAEPPAVRGVLADAARPPIVGRVVERGDARPAVPTEGAAAVEAGRPGPAAGDRPGTKPPYAEPAPAMPPPSPGTRPPYAEPAPAALTTPVGQADAEAAGVPSARVAPASTAPVGAESTGTESAGTESTGTASGTEPADGAAAGGGPIGGDPARRRQESASPVGAQADGAGASAAAPAGAPRARAEAVRPAAPEPRRADAARSEAARSESDRAEPARTVRPKAATGAADRTARAAAVRAERLRDRLTGPQRAVRDPMPGSRTVHRAGAALRTGTPPPLNLARRPGVRPGEPREPVAGPGPRDTVSDPRAEPAGPGVRPVGPVGDGPDTALPPGAEVETYVRPGEEPPPNIGPPKERLDFRRKRPRRRR